MIIQPIKYQLRNGSMTITCGLSATEQSIASARFSHNAFGGNYPDDPTPSSLLIKRTAKLGKGEKVQKILREAEGAIIPGNFGNW